MVYFETENDVFVEHLINNKTLKNEMNTVACDMLACLTFELFI